MRELPEVDREKKGEAASFWDKAAPTLHLVQFQFCLSLQDKWTSVLPQWPWVSHSAKLVSSLPVNWGE